MDATEIAIAELQHAIYELKQKKMNNNELLEVYNTTQECYAMLLSEM